MSELLPLVATVLKDKAMVDAQDEIEELREKIQATQNSTLVEIICDAENRDDESFERDSLICASNSFANGNFHTKSSSWIVPFDELESCSFSLSHLREVSVCVGGGFPIMCIQDLIDSYHRLPVEFSNISSGTPQIFLSTFDVQLVIALEGCPKSVWESLATAQPPVSFYAFFSVFCAANPDVEAVFLGVIFNAKRIRGPLKRLLPPKSRSDVLSAMLSNEKNR